jgi:hypothetical protein
MVRRAEVRCLQRLHLHQQALHCTPHQLPSLPLHMAACTSSQLRSTCRPGVGGLGPCDHCATRQRTAWKAGWRSWQQWSMLCVAGAARVTALLRNSRCPGSRPAQSPCPSPRTPAGCQGAARRLVRTAWGTGQRGAIKDWARHLAFLRGCAVVGNAAKSLLPCHSTALLTAGTTWGSGSCRSHASPPCTSCPGASARTCGWRMTNWRFRQRDGAGDS